MKNRTIIKGLLSLCISFPLLLRAEPGGPILTCLAPDTSLKVQIKPIDSTDDIVASGYFLERCGTVHLLDCRKHPQQSHTETRRNIFQCKNPESNQNLPVEIVEVTEDDLYLPKGSYFFFYRNGNKSALAISCYFINQQVPSPWSSWLE